MVLHRNDLDCDPFKQFLKWYADVKDQKVFEYDAMTLATATAAGRPSSRTVLLKSISDGFIFYTNYESRKGVELAENPHAAALFYWKEVGRQVRIEGRVSKISREESSAYFATRPRESQVGALASFQDQKLASRKELEDAFKRVSTLYEDKQIPIPEYWGGYCLIPELFEFWESAPHRLHDRFEYVKSNNQWEIHRLSP
ncbi:MAG: pyridoxamine 5'-phosphate oxidase [Waddliaceae bacterium]